MSKGHRNQRQSANSPAEQSERTHYLSKRSNWIASISAGISSIALLVTTYQSCLIRQSMILDERAWVSAKAIKQRELKVGVPLQFDIQLQNSGRTPALSVTLTRAVIELDTAETENRDLERKFLSEVSSLGPATETPIAPNGDAHYLVESREPMTQANLAEIGRALYVMGTAHYSDIFQTNHQTEFCWKINLSAPATSGEALACPVHNSIDRQ